MIDLAIDLLVAKVIEENFTRMDADAADAREQQGIAQKGLGNRVITNKPIKEEKLEPAKTPVSTATRVLNDMSDPLYYQPDEFPTQEVRVDRAPRFSSVNRSTVLDILSANRDGLEKQGIIKMPMGMMRKADPTLDIDGLQNRILDKLNLRPPEGSVQDIQYGLGAQQLGKVEDADDQDINVDRDTPAPADVGVQPTDGKVTDLLDFIGKGEGGYNSAHSGTIGGKIQNSTSNAVRDGKKLTELTIGQIREYMNIESPRNKNRLFAVGKYQLIPDTFNLVVEKMNLSDDEIFTSELQDKMGTFLLTDKVGRKLQTWLYQDDKTIKKTNVNEAMLAFAKEFASIPVPFDIPKNPNPTFKNPYPKVDLKAGDSYYSEGVSGGNKAQHTIEETKDMLMKVEGSLKMLGQVSESPRPRQKPRGVMERPPL